MKNCYTIEQVAIIVKKIYNASRNYLNASIYKLYLITEKFAITSDYKTVYFQICIFENFPSLGRF